MADQDEEHGDEEAERKKRRKRGPRGDLGRRWPERFRDADAKPPWDSTSGDDAGNSGP